MSRYRTENLVGVAPDEFKRRIESFLGMTDYEMEGYSSPSSQRDLSIKFHWGHNHDFGTFYVPGKLQNRHIEIVAALGQDWLNVLPPRLDGMKVMDIGCWSGGTSLVLAGLGADVVAVEEVKKYVDAMEYLRQSFDLDNFHPRNLSLFECTMPEFQDAFDFI